MNSISLAQLSDASALHELVNSAYRGDTSRAGWTTEADLFDGPRISLTEMQKLFDNPLQQVFKFVENDRLLGCVGLLREGQKLYLGMLTVNPTLQGSGIGKKLLKVADDEAVRQGCEAIFMTVITVRKELLEWYHRHGYIDTGKRVELYKDDARITTAKIKIELAVLEKSL